MSGLNLFILRSKISTKSCCRPCISTYPLCGLPLWFLLFYGLQLYRWNLHNCLFRFPIAFNLVHSQLMIYWKDFIFKKTFILVANFSLGVNQVNGTHQADVVSWNGNENVKLLSSQDHADFVIGYKQPLAFYYTTGKYQFRRNRLWIDTLKSILRIIKNVQLPFLSHHYARQLLNYWYFTSVPIQQLRLQQWKIS